MSQKQQAKRKVLLVVMDGIGARQGAYGNAVVQAHTPQLDFLKKNAFYAELKAHGSSVGLPNDDDMGNSEVGHNAIGAGRIINQGALLVSDAIKNKSLYQKNSWQKMLVSIHKDKTLHFIGLLSDGNVHSHEEHLHALLKQTWKEGVKKIRIHCLLDGRDVAPQSAQIYLARLEKLIHELQQASCDIAIASVGGRMKITMDRYKADWNMVKQGWQTHVEAKGAQYNSALEGLQDQRTKNPNIIDQDISPFVIKGTAQPMEDGDTVLLFNFRGDRAIEISQAFTDKNFKHFVKEKKPQINYWGITQYDGDENIPPNYLVSPPLIKNTLGEHLCSLGLKQFACSETQKFGHVSYFWNGNRSGYFDKNLEKYLEIPSDNISFDLKPWMKAHEICEATINEMKQESFDVGRINFPNGDMVGHTGNLDASVCAVTVVDLMVGRLLQAAQKTNTTLIITADHGNCEEMYLSNDKEKPKKIKTSHTLSPVPFYLYHHKKNFKNLALKVKNPSLVNIANTVLTLMDLKTRKDYEPSLILN